MKLRGAGIALGSNWKLAKNCDLFSGMICRIKNEWESNGKDETNKRISWAAAFCLFIRVSPLLTLVQHFMVAKLGTFCWQLCCYSPFSWALAILVSLLWVQTENGMEEWNWKIEAVLLSAIRIRCCNRSSRRCKSTGISNIVWFTVFSPAMGKNCYVDG